jgi:hypothetical protein
LIHNLGFYAAAQQRYIAAGFFTFRQNFTFSKICRPFDPTEIPFFLFYESP